MPQATFTKEVGDALGRNLEDLASASLRLEKLTFLGSNSKREQIEAVCKIANTCAELPPPLPADHEFALKLGARMMVNMAGGVLENAGLCLHRHYNCPMIPGSALKGVARHAAWCEWKQIVDAGKAAEGMVLAQTISRVFGYPTGSKDLDDTLGGKNRSANAGSIAFLPAFPTSQATLVCDILTPHGGNDYTNPVPSPFMAVDCGAEFQFGLRNSQQTKNNDMENSVRWLRQGLANGVGAKSTTGYGWFINGKNSESGIWRAKLSLTTPGFFGGASHTNPNDTKLRGSSVRGLMRYWWRMLYREWLDENTLKALEGEIWGSTDDNCHASTVTVKIVGETNCHVELYNVKDGFQPTPEFRQAHDIRPPRGATPGIFYQSYGMNDGGQDRVTRHYINPGAEWTVDIDTRDHRESLKTTINKRSVVLTRDMIIRQGRIALSLLCHFGGLGSKSRKGFGSFDLKECMTLDECKSAAFELLEIVGVQISKEQRPYTFPTAIQQDIEVPWQDPWTVLDRLGLAVQSFASANKHQSTKAALGLPRKIHGPKNTPMQHQRGGHQPPVNLSPVLPDARQGNKTRFASPVHYHILPGVNGHVIRVTAFPSGDITDETTSRNVLSALVEKITTELAAMNQEGAQVAAHRPPRDHRPGGNHRPQHANIQPRQQNGMQNGVITSAKLLDEKTKKGGWKVQCDGLTGSITNNTDVPPDAQPGQLIKVKVRSNNPANASFDYIK